MTVTNVSPSLFTVLRAQPLRGRLFTPEEGRDGNWRLVILSPASGSSVSAPAKTSSARRSCSTGRRYTVVGDHAADVPISRPRTTQMWLPMRCRRSTVRTASSADRSLRALARLKARRDTGAGGRRSDRASASGAGCRARWRCRCSARKDPIQHRRWSMRTRRPPPRCGRRSSSC